MSYGKTFIIGVLSIFIYCASTGFGSYSVEYVDGIKAADKYAATLKKKNIKYRIISHRDNIFEIQYKEPKEPKE